MKKRILITAAGIVLFCILMVKAVGLERLGNFLDFDTLFYITAAGIILALTKRPKNFDTFLKYLSRTSLIAGALAAVISCTNLLKSMNPNYSAGYIGSDISFALLSVFYGLIISGISYALYREEFCRYGKGDGYYIKNRAVGANADKFNEAVKILNERFGQGAQMSLAAVTNKRPVIRNVSGYYEDGAFYIINGADREIIRQINNNTAAVCCDGFTANGTGEDIGHPRELGGALPVKLKELLSGGGETGADDPDACVLRIRLTDGVLADRESKYELDFVKHTVK